MIATIQVLIREESRRANEINLRKQWRWDNLAAVRYGAPQSHDDDDFAQECALIRLQNPGIAEHEARNKARQNLGF
jgi:hypothetical protein